MSWHVKQHAPLSLPPEKLKRTLSLDGQGNRELARYNNIPTLILGSGSSDLSQRWLVAMRHFPHKKTVFAATIFKGRPCVRLDRQRPERFILREFQGLFCDEKAERTIQ